VLDSGRRIQLKELRQFRTYEGRAEGLPTKEHNQVLQDRLMASHAGQSYPHGPACLIRPEERDLLYRGGKSYPLGTPAAMPAITCIGRFESSSPARDQSMDCSALLVIWFQEQFAFPVDPVAMARIAAIDWDGLAVDLPY